MSFGGSAAESGMPTAVLSITSTYDGIQRPIGACATVGGSTIWSEGLTYDFQTNILAHGHFWGEMGLSLVKDEFMRLTDLLLKKTLRKKDPEVYPPTDH